MILLHFAHGAEASEFIKNLELKAQGDGIYSNEKLILCISKEGIYDTLVKLTHICSLNKISKIINYGIAGSFTQKLPLHEVISIRTAYGHNEKKPRFHSFTSSDENAQYDCITTENRIIHDEDMNQLEKFAELVDRELWAVGKVAKEFKIPFFSYKLISDYAGKNTHCLQIKEQATLYSQRLLEFHLEQDFQQQKIHEEKEVSYPLTMSFYNQKRFEKLAKKLIISKKYNNIKEINEDPMIQLFLEEKDKDKDKANKIIKFLEEKLNPFQIKIDHRLEEVFAPLTKKGIKLKLDPQLEKRKFTLSYEINSSKNIQDLIIACKDFKFQDLEEIWDGKIDV